MEKITVAEIRSSLGAAGSTARNALTMDGYRRAGVLVPIISTDAGLDLLFTKRTQSVETHKGQISFPGGVADNSDDHIVATALREVFEEIGLSPSCIEVVGMLDDMTTPTGFLITPVIGIIEVPPALIINSAEVAEVFQVPLQVFLEPSRCRSEIREVRGKKQEVWFYDCGRHIIWGATAHIVRSLLGKVDTLR